MEILISHNYKIAIDNKWDNVNDWGAIRFKIANCHDIVSEFEGLSKQYEKDSFIKKYSGFRYGFDDLKKESEASNYGKKQLVRALFEKRYDGNKITHGTANYHNEYPGDLIKGLDEFGVKYGGHIYDRMFEMFNILEFKGTSFRK